MRHHVRVHNSRTNRQAYLPIQKGARTTHQESKRHGIPRRKLWAKMHLTSGPTPGLGRPPRRPTLDLLSVTNTRLRSATSPQRSSGSCSRIQLQYRRTE